MAFSLAPPGSRNRNAAWVARGRNEAGAWIEKSTGCQTKAQAQKWLKAHLAELMQPRAKKPGARLPAATPETMTFGDAVERYCAWRGIELGYAGSGDARHDMRRFLRLKDELGDIRLADVTGDDLVRLARAQRDRKGHPWAPATMNREVMTPGRCVHTYAYRQGWCKALRIEPFPIPDPGLRYVSGDVKDRLLAATSGRQHLLIAWLFGTGMRIEDTLQRVIWPDPSRPGARLGIDLEQGTITLLIGKTQRVKTLRLPAMLLDLLRAIPVAERVPGQRLFTWGNQQNVNRWLHPLRQRLGVHFTPQMARHTVGHELAEMGAALPTIMQVLTHATVTSSMRYQSVSAETVQTAVDRLLPMGASDGAKMAS